MHIKHRIMPSSPFSVKLMHSSALIHLIVNIAIKSKNIWDEAKSAYPQDERNEFYAYCQNVTII